MTGDGELETGLGVEFKSKHFFNVLNFTGFFESKFVVERGRIAFSGDVAGQQFFGAGKSPDMINDQHHGLIPVTLALMLYCDHQPSKEVFRLFFIGIKHHKTYWFLSGENSMEPGFFAEIGYSFQVGVWRNKTLLIFSHIQLHDRPDGFRCGSRRVIISVIV